MKTTEEEKVEIPELDLVRTIEGHKSESIFSLCVLRDKRLVSGDENGSVIVYKLETYAPDITIKEDTLIYSVCGLKDGNLAASTHTREIFVWVINGKDHKLKIKIKSHTGVVTKIIELKNQNLCSCSFDGTIKIWDYKNNYKLAQSIEVSAGDKNVQRTEVSNERNDTQKAGVRNNPQSKFLSYWVRSVLELDNNMILSFSDDERVRLWGKEKGEYKIFSTILDVYCHSRNGASILEDGSTVIVGGIDKLFTIKVPSFETKCYEEKKKKKFGTIYSTVPLRGSQVLLGCKGGNIFCFDVKAGVILSKVKYHFDDTFCIIKSGDNTIFSSSRDEINCYKF